MKTTGLPVQNTSPAPTESAGPDAGAATDESVRVLRTQTRTSVQQLADDAAQIARHSADAARQRAVSLRDAGSEYIRERPLQAVMIAAGTGAVLMLLASLLRHRSGNPR